METEQIFVFDKLTINYDIVEKKLVFKLSGRIETHIDFVCIQIMAYSKTKKIHSIIFEFSEMIGSITDFAYFLESEYLPYLLTNNLNCCAFVIPHNINIWEAIDHIQKQFFYLETKQFIDFGKADAWVKLKLNYY